MKKTLNRWVYAIIGVIVLLLAGMVYSWTVMSSPIAAMYPEWTKAQLSLTFTITMFCFCPGVFCGGLLLKKCQPKILLWLSAVLFILGFVVSSRAQSLIMLYLGFGILAGLASGFAYNAVMSSVGKWFPDKQGLISGLLLMGYGIGSFIIGKIYTAVTPSDGGPAWRSTFLIFGIIVAIVMAIAGFFIVRPSDDWQAPAPKKALKKKAESYEEINTITMLKRPSCWLFFFWAVLISTAWFGIVSQGSPMAMEAMRIQGGSATAAQMSSIATIVGLISIFNGIGRIVFGWLFDKLGRLLTMIIGGVLFACGMLLILWSIKSHSTGILVASYILTGFSFGSVTPTISAFTSLFYGLKNYPTNYSIFNMNLLIASFGSTLAGKLFDASGSYALILLVNVALIVVALILAILIKKPKTAVK